MADELPKSRLAVWELVEPIICVWTLLTPSEGDGDGELDFSDPDDSGLLPGL
jgi:hypothetical protein